MKLVTKEEEDAHYNAVLQGGTVGGIAGLAAGYAGVMLASRRFPTIRNLTLPMKAFLVSSAGTFTGIVGADHSSQTWQNQHQQEKSFLGDREARLRQEELSGLTTSEKMMAYFKKEKYKIVGVTWLASMLGSWILISRNKYLTAPQKVVQARVYAQGLTVAVLVATAGLEIHDQRKGQGLLETAKAKRSKAAKEAGVRPEHHERYKGEDMWKDMVDAEEERIKEKEAKAAHKKA